MIVLGINKLLRYRDCITENINDSIISDHIIYYNVIIILGWICKLIICIQTELHPHCF